MSGDSERSVSKALTVDQARDMAIRYFNRRGLFEEEDKITSFLVVVLNYGDHLTEVSCIAGEWNGMKGDLQSREGIPLCPNGHPLLENAYQLRLGLIPESR